MHVIERLIIAVQQRPCLWDIEHQDYHNRDIKEEAWQDVCRQITVNYDKFDRTTKYETCLMYKKKWTNIRDSYRKELHSLGQIPTGTRKRKYKYAQRLRFLKPSIRVRQPKPVVETNNESSEEESDRDVESPSRKIQIVSIQQEFKEDRTSPTYPDVCPSPANVPTPKEFVNTLDMSEPFPVNQIPKVQTPPIEDDDTKFLLSFRGDMKTMNQNQKIEFKIGMLQLVRKIVQSDQDPPSPSIVI